MRVLSKFALPAIVLLLVACGSTPPAMLSAADRRGVLEAELARLPASTDTATTLRRSRLLRSLGRHDEALQELAAATEAARERLSWNDLAALWREIGALHLEQGRVEQALDTFGKRLSAAQSLGEPLTRASALVDTAYAFALLGQLGQADEAVTEARVVGGERLLDDPLDVERLGLVADLLDDDEKARLLLAQAADGHRAAGDRAAAARALVQAARIAWSESGEAAELLRLDATVAELNDAEPAALLRRYQAEARFLAHDHGGCSKTAGEAVALADGRGLPSVGKVARMIAARCADKMGQLEEAVRLAREACSMVELELRQVTGDIARQQLGFEAFVFYRILLALEASRKAPDRVERAFVVSERARARAHLDAVARAQLGQRIASVSPALERDRKAAEERIRLLTRELLAKRSRRAAEQHERSLWALEEIKDSILRQNPLLSRVTPPDPARVADVQSELLDDDGILLSYFSTNERVLLFAIDRKEASLHELAGSAEDIDAAVRRFTARHLLDPSVAETEVKRAGKALFQTLLGPVAARIAQKRRWIVVPHGALSALPFESLVDASGAYVVEKHQLVYSLSATLGVALAKRPAPDAARRSFVGLGDPVYDWNAFSSGRAEGTALVATRALELWTAADEAANQKSRGLERLPGTAKELRDIARLFPDHQLYLRDQASEELVKKGSLAGFRIVHVASHGLMAPHYQALALTLRPDAEQDGFLMNSEIAELELDADLVVLSACRTGNMHRAYDTAEPVAGLALSLRSAGARRVVLSLWSVDDEATAELMRRFYEPLVKEQADYAASLAAAKRAMIAQGRFAHPFYWAAFVLNGS